MSTAPETKGSTQDSNLPPEWLYRRFQAVGRAQTHYLLLLILGAAYTLAVESGSAETVNVGFLGVSVPKPIMRAFAVLVLGVLMLACLGTFKAAALAFDMLQRALGESGRSLSMYFIDEHPTIADFPSYATLIEGKPGRLTRFGWVVLYPAPLLSVFGWTIALWWVGVDARPYVPRWLWSIHAVNTALLLVACWQMGVFVKRRWVRFMGDEELRKVAARETL